TLLRLVIKIGLIESTEPRIINYDVVSLRFELGYDVGVPSVPDQQPTFPSIRGLNFLTDAKFQMAGAIHGIGRAEIGKVRAITHLEINDFQPSLARGCEHFCRGANRFLRP